MQKHCIKSSSNICFRYLLELPRRGNSNKCPKHMFSEEIRKKGLFLPIILSIKDSLQQQIHYNGNVCGNKYCRCSEGSLYLSEMVIIMPQILIKIYTTYQNADEYYKS